MKRLSTGWLMAPRWGSGRELIGTDAKTSAETANHPQNHPPLKSCHRTALPPGLNTPPPQSLWLPPRSAWLPCPSRRRWMHSWRLRAFRSRAGLDGASPPARVLVSNAHVVPRRPPALVIPAAPYPCRAPLQGMGGVCFPRLAVAASVPLHGSGLLREQAPRSAGLGRERGSLPAAACTPLIPALLPAWLYILQE